MQFSNIKLNLVQIVGELMSKADIFMIIEAILILAFVGYMWWKSKPPKK